MVQSRYVSTEEIRRRMDKTDDVDDLVIFQIAEAAADQIDDFCNRTEGFNASDTAEIRYYAGNGKAYLLIDECVAITEVAVKDAVTDTTYTAWASPSANMAGDGDWFAFTGDRKAPDFNTLPYTALQVDLNGDQSNFTNGAYTGLRGFPRRVDEGILEQSAPTVRVTARWGFAAETPNKIREACAMQAVIWYKRYEGAMASSLANVDLGTLELFQSLDPAIEFILRLGRMVRPATGRK